MWKRNRKRLAAVDLAGPVSLPVTVHIFRSRSGIDSLDERLNGRRLHVADRGVDSDGGEYLVLGDDELFAYVDQLDFDYVDTRWAGTNPKISAPR